MIRKYMMMLMMMRPPPGEGLFVVELDGIYQDCNRCGPRSSRVVAAE